MVDTNVIISAILKEDSFPDLVLTEVCENHALILCDYIINENYDVAKRRFPMRIQMLDRLFAKLRYELVTAPRHGEIQMRDVKDMLKIYMIGEMGARAKGEKLNFYHFARSILPFSSQDYKHFSLLYTD